MTRETWRDDLAEESIRNRARRGAKALDEAFGKRWHEQVDDLILQMDSGQWCVLGQLGANGAPYPQSGYGFALARVKDRLNVRSRGYGDSLWECAHGFEVQRQYGVSHDVAHTWSLLQKQWLREIAKRRARDYTIKEIAA